MDCIGYVDEVNRFHIAGWVADQDRWETPLNVDILVNGEGRGTCTADLFRPDLDKLHPHATGRYAFRFYFADPLSMYSEHDVSVRVSGTTFYLKRDQDPLGPIEARITASACRPAGPILVSTLGRTGSTAVMATLAQHPKIVVGGSKPFEVEMGCYYAYALRTMLAKGDHERSLRTDEITAIANRFHIGFNPYFEASFANVFSDRQTLDRFLTTRMPGRLASTFRDIITDYYEEVAADTGKDSPIYFAEKSLPERDSRLGIRFMFPNLKEIVLIRDLRDVVCSSTTSNGVPFQQIVEDTVSGARQIQAVLAEDRSGKFVLKYEDFVRDKAGVTDRLFQFLGLAPTAADDSAMVKLFASHATSANPIASIGRWQRDLTTAQKRDLEVFNPLLETFGYAA